MYLRYNTDSLGKGKMKLLCFKRYNQEKGDKLTQSGSAFSVTSVNSQKSCLQNLGLCYLTAPYIILSGQGHCWLSAVAKLFIN